MPPRIDYQGRRFRPVHDARQPAGGEVPTADYHQDRDLVWAEFAGADILAGRLVGRCRRDGTIDAAYCWVTTSGQTVAGACVSTPAVQPDGRVRLTEQWRRIDGAVGVSHIEEVARD